MQVAAAYDMVLLVNWQRPDSLEDYLMPADINWSFANDTRLTPLLTVPLQKDVGHTFHVVGLYRSAAMHVVPLTEQHITVAFALVSTPYSYPHRAVISPRRAAMGTLHCTVIAVTTTFSHISEYQTSLQPS